MYLQEQKQLFRCTRITLSERNSGGAIGFAPRFQDNKTPPVRGAGRPLSGGGRTPGADKDVTFSGAVGDDNPLQALTISQGDYATFNGETTVDGALTITVSDDVKFKEELILLFNIALILSQKRSINRLKNMKNNTQMD